MTDRNIVVTTVDDFFKSAGFVKRSGSWYSRSPETVTVVNLQKSQYGPVFYLNYGIWILSVEEVENPPPNKCHLVGRLTSVFPGETKSLDQLFDLRLEIDDGERRERLTAFLGGEALPLLRQAETLCGLQAGEGKQLVSKAGVKAPVVHLFPPR